MDRKTGEYPKEVIGDGDTTRGRKKKRAPRQMTQKLRIIKSSKNGSNLWQVYR
jgi:hypothetical protein